MVRQLDVVRPQREPEQRRPEVRRLERQAQQPEPLGRLHGVQRERRRVLQQRVLLRVWQMAPES